MRPAVGMSMDYPRHCAALAVVSAALALAGRWRPAWDAIPSVGLYALMHSSMLAATLRPRQTVRRNGAFIGAAVGLAMLSLELARLVSHALVALPGSRSPALLLMLASGFGAAGYAWLIRRLMIVDLPLRAVPRLALYCVASTLLGLPVGVHLHVVGGWWFAVIWWWTFSLALWHHDVHVPPVGLTGVRRS